MAGIFQSFMTGVEGGRASFDRRRARDGQERAASLLMTGDRSGAARELMASGQFGEAATLSNVSMVNQRQDAAQRAGTAAAGGDYGRASAEMYGSGALDEGKAFDAEARNRTAGAQLLEDPRKAAETQARGGDISQATQIVDWANRADATEREAAINGLKVMSPILMRAAAVPYEQRRAFIQQNSQALNGAGFTPEQIDQFDPTDENIRTMSDTALGLEAVLGSYSQRVVGDEVRTYRTNPYGVERTGSEPVPYSRDEARDDKRLQFEEERIRLQERALAVANTTGDVLAPLLQRYSRGEPLNPQEEQIVQSYLSRSQGGDEWGGGGVPGLPGVAAPGAMTGTAPPPPVGANGAAQSNRSGIAPTGVQQRPGDPFPGIAEGQTVEQDGVRYQRRGNQMVRVQ